MQTLSVYQAATFFVLGYFQQKFPGMLSISVGINSKN